MPRSHHAVCLLHRQAAINAGTTEEELVEAVHVATALRAGGAITHGTHLLQTDGGASSQQGIQDDSGAQKL